MPNVKTDYCIECQCFEDENNGYDKASTLEQTTLTSTNKIINTGSIFTTNDQVSIETTTRKDTISTSSATNKQQKQTIASLGMTPSVTSDTMSAVSTTEKDITPLSSLRMTTKRDVAILTSMSSATISTCLHENLVGDGYCDDEANNLICDYDGGDCCSSEINTLFCNECQCIGMQ